MLHQCMLENTIHAIKFYSNIAYMEYNKSIMGSMEGRYKFGENLDSKLSKILSVIYLGLLMGFMSDLLAVRCDLAFQNFKVLYRFRS